MCIKQFIDLIEKPQWQNKKSRARVQSYAQFLYHHIHLSVFGENKAHLISWS
jgi:hypothetical protein